MYINICIFELLKTEGDFLNRNTCEKVGCYCMNPSQSQARLTCKCLKYLGGGDNVLKINFGNSVKILGSTISLME